MTDDVAAVRPGSAQLSRIARSGSFNMLGAFVAAVCNFLLVVVVTHLFDKATAGMLFSATSLFLILVAASTLGTESGLARFMLRFRALGRDVDIPTCLRIAWRPVLFTSLALTLVMVVFAPWLANIMGLTQTPGSTVLIALAVLLPVAALGDFALSAGRAFGSIRGTVWLEKVLRPAGQPIGALIVALLGGGILALTVSWIAPYALASVLAIFTFRKILARKGLSGSLQPTTDPRHIRKEFWAFTWPRAVARIAQITLQRADIILVAALLSVQHAAVYAAATRFVVIGQFASNAMQQVLQPRFSQLLTNGQTAEVAVVFRTSTSWSMAIAWPLYIVTAAGFNWYLQLFGEGYAGTEAAVVVVSMSIAMLLSVSTGPLDTMLLMSGRSIASLVISLTILAVDLTLCLLLIPQIGITGAALAWAAAVVLKSALTFTQVRSSLRISPFSRAGFLVVLANVVCFALPLVSVTVFWPTNLWLYASVLVAGCAGYAGLCWAWRDALNLSAFRSLRKGKIERPEEAK